MKKLILLILLLTITLLADTWTQVNTGPSLTPFYQPEMFWNSLLSTNGTSPIAVSTLPFYDQRLAMNAVVVSNGSGTYALPVRILDGSSSGGSGTYPSNISADSLTLSNGGKIWLTPQNARTNSYIYHDSTNIIFWSSRYITTTTKETNILIFTTF